MEDYGSLFFEDNFNENLRLKGVYYNGLLCNNKKGVYAMINIKRGSQNDYYYHTKY